MATFMAYAGGIPTFITLGVFLVTLLFLSRKRTVSISKLKSMKASAKVANVNYYAIKAKLPTVKPLVRLRFHILVGAKRWRDYNYQG